MQEKEARKNAPKNVKRVEDSSDIFTEKDVVGGQPETAKKPEEVKYKRDVTPMPDYYKAWDKFDVDEDSSEDENGNKKSKITYKEPEAPKTQADMMRPTSGAAPNTKIVIKGGT